jgi:hypothetical protein
MSRRAGAWLLVATLLGLAGHAAANVTFTSKEGRFSVELPKDPTPSDEPLETAQGKLVMHIFGVALDDRAFLVAYIDYPDDGGMTAAKRVQIAIDSEVQGQHGKLIGKAVPCDTKKLVCRQASYSAPMDATTTMLKTMRIYLVGRRLYHVAIMTSTTAPAKPEVIRALFDSFKIL